MKLEKRGGGDPAPSAEENADKRKKPVVIYIMILFIAAFLLMAWSFASHQRSNTEALGRLQSSVSAMQEVQDLQDQVIALQKELAEMRKTMDTLEEEASAGQDAVESLEKQAAAMQRLYVLQQQYAAGDYEACRQTIALFEAQGTADLLPSLDNGNVTPPAIRYQQLKEAVEAQTEQGN